MGDFEKLLQTYKDNYASYRITGNTANKVAYEKAVVEINKRIEASKKTLSDDSAFIQNFLDKYADTNPKIDALHKQAQNIQKDGPAIQNEYEVSKRLNAAPRVQPVNDTYLYVKGSIVVALLIIVGIVGAL